jgi:hypothetical protein
MGPVLDQIRDAIRRSEKSRYRLARETGLTESLLCHMMAGRRGLSLGTLERLAACLELEIVVRPCRKKKGR